VSIANGPIPNQHPTGSILVSKARCTQVKSVRTPLAPAGLPGPPARFEQYVECPVSRRVLIRFRADLDRRPNWVADGRGFVITRANVSGAQMAVHTYPANAAARKALAFAAFSKAGEIEAYLSPDCE
jgi:hypothetical protein